MWFKQLSVFPVEFNLTAEQLESKLSELHFKPILGLDSFSDGFDTPNAFCDSMVSHVGNTYCMALRSEEKIIPSSVVKNLLEKKIKEISDKEARAVGRKEKNELKERIIDDLLPKAFVKSRLIHAIVINNWLLINDSSPKRAEKLLSKLREACGGLNARLPNTQMSPSALMTDWLLKGQAQGSFAIGNSTVLEGAGDIRPNIKVNKKDLTEAEIIRHAELGMTVKEMELVWREQVSFILTSNFNLKKISFLDVVQIQSEEQSEDAQTLWNAEQVLCATALSEIVEELTELLGGIL